MYYLAGIRGHDPRTRQLPVAGLKVAELARSPALAHALSDGRPGDWRAREPTRLRTIWSAGTRKRVLIVEPPRKSSKLWIVSFYSWPHPADDAQARADLADFDAAMTGAGKLKLRRGNAALFSARPACSFWTWVKPSSRPTSF